MAAVFIVGTLYFFVNMIFVSHTLVLVNSPSLIEANQLLAVPYANPTKNYAPLVSLTQCLPTSNLLILSA